MGKRGNRGFGRREFESSRCVEWVVGKWADVGRSSDVGLFGNVGGTILDVPFRQSGSEWLATTMIMIMVYCTLLDPGTAPHHRNHVVIYRV